MGGGALQACQQQQIGDQLLQPPALRQGAIEVCLSPAAAAGRRRCAALSLDDGQEIGEGCAQLVCDIGTELLLLPVRLQQGGHGQSRQPPAGKRHRHHCQRPDPMAQPPQPLRLRIQISQAARNLEVAPDRFAGAMGVVKVDHVGAPALTEPLTGERPTQ